MPRQKPELPKPPTPSDMEITPERALRIKLALIRQYEDQYGVTVHGFYEMNKSNEVVGSWHR